ncbi:MAG: NAD+ synthase, partial [Patescibacteria group bacterium]|nr:NAD+ synthase [Patescibacteria group bacterium]
MFEINYPEEVEKISEWIKNTVKSSGFSKIVIAVSGGIDSAVSTALCVKAIGPENVFCVLLPYGKLSGEHTKDAKDILKSFQIPLENIKEINIQEAVDSIIKNISDVNEIRKGNIMARVRMIYIFDSAKKLNAIVCGTENKTEHYLGYFTRFGDEASDLEPIKKFYKTQIWEFGKILNVPEKIIAKAPTAGLWEEQTDEGELGFTYKEADKIL